jgi:hypothetical protein
MVGQHRDKAFRCIQIADKKGDWARSVGQLPFGCPVRVDGAMAAGSGFGRTPVPDL